MLGHADHPCTPSPLSIWVSASASVQHAAAGADLCMLLLSFSSSASFGATGDHRHRAGHQRQRAVL